MGASHIAAAYALYAAKVPSTPFKVLVYMALITPDRDAEPQFWQGHEALAVHCFGYREPITPAGLRAVRRAITPLFDTGAITVARHSSGHGARAITVRYRLHLDRPAPDEMRPQVHQGGGRTFGPDDDPDPFAPDGNRPVHNSSKSRADSSAPDGNRPTRTDGAGRKATGASARVGRKQSERRTETVRLRNKEENLKQEREEKQEEIISSSNSVPPPVREAPDDAREIDQATEVEASGDAGASLPEPAKPADVGTATAPRVGYRWRDPREIAAEQAAESRARREAAERAQAEAVTT